ncbi:MULTISPECIES: hypothetical protein [Pseudomonas]|uniref:Gluconate 2-dehydrogenase n=1 Tax=Pseudomonas putida TaxID=303 RepID=A0A379KPR8_PSEPU|nr:MULTISPECIES: hypothetical protein [Pseudomonas]MBG6127676.1 hypothetical protein [Pseudomonas sp. M2]NSX20783.1 hypothetical protein [Pseudomonas putida]SUD69387.1 gluconate 2-dehydrogenase [Pseudomonas putida]HDS1744641.1 hypothetical protein [Pseudomonas putida]
MSDTPNARRHFLQGGLALIPLVTLASHGVPTVFGDTPRQPATTQLPPDDYRPRFFTDVELAFVQAACEQLIPTDELGPVPIFLRATSVGAAWFSKMVSLSGGLTLGSTLESEKSLRIQSSAPRGTPRSAYYRKR